MYDPPLYPLLITPDLRRRLQQCYDEAQRLTAQARPDFRRIHDLLAECLRADPGNILYLNALFANLMRRDAVSTRQTSWFKWFGAAKRRHRITNVKKPTPTTAHGILQEMPAVLWE